MKIYPMVVGPVQVNCYILSREGRAVIVDPGDSAQKILNYLNTHRLTVEAILLTHGHFDHIGAVNELAQVLKVPVYAHKKEQAYFDEPGLNLSTMIYQNLVLAKTLDIRYLADGGCLDIIGTRCQIFHVPGHTLGSICFYFEKEGVVFTGDTLFSYSIGRTDFPKGSHDQLVAAIKDKLLVLPGDTVVYPGHNEATTISQQIAGNPHLR